MSVEMVEGSEPFELPARKRWRSEDAQRVLAAWEASGETLEEFAHGLGIEAQRLDRWRRLLGIGKRSSQPPGPQEASADRPTFIPARLAAAPPPVTGCVLVVSFGDLRIEVRDAAALPSSWVASLLLEVGVHES